jgi:hypothetical protein
VPNRTRSVHDAKNANISNGSGITVPDPGALGMRPDAEYE